MLKEESKLHSEAQSKIEEKEASLRIVEKLVQKEQAALKELQDLQRAKKAVDDDLENDKASENGRKEVAEEQVADNRNSTRQADGREPKFLKETTNYSPQDLTQPPLSPLLTISVPNTTGEIMADRSQIFGDLFLECTDQDKKLIESVPQEFQKLAEILARRMSTLAIIQHEEAYARKIDEEQITLVDYPPLLLLRPYLKWLLR